MRQASKTLVFKELKLLDLVMTGEAARIAGCDRRTFQAWAKKLKVKPMAVLKGNKEVYKLEDAEKIAKAYQAFQKEKEGPK